MRLKVPRFADMNVVKLESRWSDRFAAPVRTNAAVSWKPDSLNLRFDVDEPQIRALETDPWLVHRDSCAEFFFSLPGELEYFNLEVNAAGRLLYARGKSRENRLDLTETLGRMISIDGSHVGRDPFDIRGTAWWISIIIPPQAVDIDAWGDDVDTLRANLYKCGDALDSPYYLSWSPMTAKDPDYHRPADFGELVLID
jgi:hypothetical protein